MTYSLITGASGGIGYELAKVFAKNKHNLILVAQNKKRLNEIKKELSEKYSILVEVITMDMTSKDAAKKIYEETKNKGYKIDNLINNAGFGDWSEFVESNWERQYNMVQLNIVALMQMSYLYGKDMKEEKRGHIMNLSSIASFCAGPYMSVYYATKEYVLSFSQALAEELKKYNVTVTALCPGPTSTNFEKNAKMKDSKMFTFFRPAIAEYVAEYGYKQMMKGKIIAYHGKYTKSMNIISRLLPKRVTRKFATNINGIPK